MAKHMLIDATHPEETRVVVVDGKRLEEFDIELASKKQLKGNIYLAKVTRVEPSLQAAFVDYGGNRHGFLAFSEIHPDYYRIPVADREALLAEEAREAAAEEAREEAREAAVEARRAGRRRGGAAPERYEADRYESEREEAEQAEAAEDAGRRVPEELWPSQALGFGRDRLASDDIYDADEDDQDYPAGGGSAAAADTTAEAPSGGEQDSGAAEGDAEDGGGWAAAEEEDRDGTTGDAGADADQRAAAGTAGEEQAAIEPPIAAGESTGTIVQAEAQAVPVEIIGGDEIEEVQPRRSPRSLRSYKIQEVVKRRQVMLVQVTKEERGTKGAALTTYLSLAGRYCVLMPNTARGGGVSRKISSPTDRKRLKAILEELDIPEGMAVIIRTAGAERSKAELKRDYEYLLRLWDEIRELTLKSSAPALVYEEANLIKRSIRDLYSRDIEDVIVDGEEGYKVAKSFMRTLTPSHAKRVQLYRDPTPLFHRYQVESQLDAIHNPVVQLKSGGYIVINSTEALVAIDVNSGRATRERNIEETAYKTNLEAAEEIARQLRLRDLAGLIVIDFIDMDESRHNVAVERRLKEAMRHDRARIQIGRISAFGLLELSRQRLRPSLFETSNELCQHCRGTGHVRSTESTALHVLRSIEDECLKSRNAVGLSVAVPTAVALYVLNHKRKALAEIENRHGVRIFLSGDDHLIPPEYRVERLKALAPGEQVRPPVQQAIAGPVAEAEEAELVEEEEEEEAAAAEARGEAGAETEEQRRKRSRRRRRGRDRARGRGRERAEEALPVPVSAEPEAEAAEEAEAEAAAPAPGGAEGGEETRRRRRRGRRGGRRRRRAGEPGAEGGLPGTAAEEAYEIGGEEGEEEAEGILEPVEEAAAEGEAVTAEAQAGAGGRPRRRRRRRPAEAAAEEAVETVEAELAETATAPGVRPEIGVWEPAAAAAASEPLAEPEPAPETVEPAPVTAAAPSPVAISVATEEAVPAEAAVQAPAAEPAAEPAPKAPRRGWWRRLAE